MVYPFLKLGILIQIDTKNMSNIYNTNQRCTKYPNFKSITIFEALENWKTHGLKYVDM